MYVSKIRQTEPYHVWPLVATWWPLSFAGAFSATQQSPGDAAKRGRICTGAGSREAGLGSAFENPKGNGFGDP